MSLKSTLLGAIAAVSFALPAFAEIVADDGERQGRPGDEDFEEFESFSGTDVSELDDTAVRALLVESGLWTAIRRRPFSNVPAPGETCRSIFVTAIDTNPLAADPALIISEQREAFAAGQDLLAKSAAQMRARASCSAIPACRTWT